MTAKEYLKQLSIVILGILIAFWVSNIGSNYKDRVTQKQVLLTILNELKDNNEKLNITINSLDSLRETFHKVQNKDIESNVLAINYLALQLKNIGYETAKTTGILKDVDYKMTSKIVGNYESQNSLAEAEKLVIDELLLVLKNKIGNVDSIDYLMLQILNLQNHLEDFDTEQKQLIEALMVSLDVEG